ncbi:MAG: D-amino-acid transaminase [Rhodospirillales bacterium]|jgi:D-alanine transaminase|nr:D-amino-acid transaminase [Rhodospirillales bacterium]
MGGIAYVNGRYLPIAAAAISVEDRGFQFADGVYEVIALHRGVLIDEEPHFARLSRSLAAVGMAWPMPKPALRAVIREVARRNRVDDDGTLYLQVTRGVSPRAHAFPAGLRPTLAMTARRLPAFTFERARQGVAVITLADQRWSRCDIKSVALLPNVLGKQRAAESGAFEAWLIAGDGTVTEGTASNAWIITKGGEIITRPLGHAILGGITREAVRCLAAENQLALVERPFTVAEALAAAEAFLTSTTSFVRPVVRIDDKPVGDGRPGPLTERLLRLYMQRMDQAATVTARARAGVKG